AGPAAGTPPRATSTGLWPPPAWSLTCAAVRAGTIGAGSARRPLLFRELCSVLLHGTGRKDSLDRMMAEGHSGGVSTRTASPTSISAPATPMAPVMFILASCVSLQFGAALAVQLFPSLGTWGTTTLRLGLSAVVLLAITRPRIHRFTRDQWIAVIVFGAVVGAMNGSFYAAIERIPLGTAVAIEFLGPLTVSAILSSRRSDLLWVVLALAGVSLFGFESLSGAADLD